MPAASDAAAAGPRAPAFLMGIGLGGFVDGIVLHQILQWHHMLTGDNGGEPPDTVAGLEANTLADGFFHVATWFLVAVATLLTVGRGSAGELRRRGARTSACCSPAGAPSTSSRASSTTRSSASTTYATTSARRWDGISASSPSGSAHRRRPGLARSGARLEHGRARSAGAAIDAR